MAFKMIAESADKIKFKYSLCAQVRVVVQRFKLLRVCYSVAGAARDGPGFRNSESPAHRHGATGHGPAGSPPAGLADTVLVTGSAQNWAAALTAGLSRSRRRRPGRVGCFAISITFESDSDW